MAEADNTLAGLIQMNDTNLADIDVSDILQDAPVLAALFAQTASNGTLHKYLKKTVAAGAAFRDINTGRANAAAQRTLVTRTLKLLDASFERDKGAALAYGKGKAAFMDMEGEEALMAAFRVAEEQIINGTGNSSDGFVSIADDLAALADNMTYNAGGDTADSQTSVYLVRSGQSDVSVIVGEDGKIDVGEVYETTIVDPTDATLNISALAQAIMGWLGVQLGSVFSAARIVNVDAGSPVTDDLIAEGLALFPAGRKPNQIWMNAASVKQLRESRTATNPTGAPAPFPTEVFGIPIIETDAITSTEAVVA